MPDAEIRITTVTQDASGFLVQLHISDEVRPDVAPATSLTLTVRVPAFETPLLAHLQREAMKTAHETLSNLLEKSVREIRKTRLDLTPRVAS
jgi:hypothetical protein